MPVAISIEHARRLALHAQGLALPPTPGLTVDDVVQRIGCLQLDPVSAVARSPLLVLRARMRGGTARSHDRALAEAAYGRRRLFDYWCHEASLCHVHDLDLHRWAMRTHIQRLSSAKAHRARWLAENAGFVDHLLEDLGARGPLAARELEDRSASAWKWGHWTDEVSSRQTIARLMDLLWMQGRVGVADREGPGRRWDLIERCLPSGLLDTADARPWPEHEVVRRAALRSLSMLGVARQAHINAHFTRRRYPALATALGELEDEGEVVRCSVGALRGEWWARSSDVERVGELAPGARTVALSPFDNLLCDRARMAELFGFDHRLEIYVPRPRRRWGYYVMPILHRERIVARADVRVEGERLRAVAVDHEAGRRASGAVRRALTALARWRGCVLAEA